MSYHYQKWVLEMLEAAKATSEQLGVFPGAVTPEAVVAQAALESDWGAKAIGHNIFGIKAGKDWPGKRQIARTREWGGTKYVFIDDSFRDYESKADSIADHFNLLRRYPRYADVFKARSNRDYYQAMKDGGYATAPNYVEALVDVERSVRAFAGMPPLPKPSRQLVIGDKGDDVRGVQEALNKKFNAMLDLDGDFGSTTMLAVRHFQQKRGLTADGVVGPQTRQALDLA